LGKRWGGKDLRPFDNWEVRITSEGIGDSNQTLKGVGTWREIGMNEKEGGVGHVSLIVFWGGKKFNSC